MNPKWIRYIESVCTGLSVGIKKSITSSIVFSVILYQPHSPLPKLL